MVSNKRAKKHYTSCTKVRIVPEPRKEVDVEKLVRAIIAVTEKATKRQAA